MMPLRFVDTGPLRSEPAFRRLWIGTTAAGLGGQVATVAVLSQVWQLTGNTFWTGAIGIAIAVPTALGGLLGGTLADTMDRRRLVLWTTSGSIVVALALAAQAAVGTGGRVNRVLLVLGLLAAEAAVTALGSAARRTFVARLLPAPLVPAGVALNHLSFQAAMLVGPAAGGAVLAVGGPSTAYVLQAAAITISLYGVLRLPCVHSQAVVKLRSVDPAGADGIASRKSLRILVRSGLQSTREGWVFVLRRPTLRGCLGTDLAATVLAMPVALFPAVNDDRFGGRKMILGLFLSAIAMGGLLVGLASGTLTRTRQPGRLMLIAAATWGMALAAFALVDSLAATLAFLALAGAADTAAVISRGTILQLSTPDAYRGRVSAAENIIGVAGPGLGNARAGALASITSSSISALAGGVACLLAVGAIATVNPALHRWTTPREPATPGS